MLSHLALFGLGRGTPSRSGLTPLVGEQTGNGTSPAVGEALREVVMGSGLFGWIAIVVALILLVWGGLLIARRPERPVFVLLGLMALLPPLIGAVGMWVTQAGIQREVQAAEQRGDSVAKPEIALRSDRAEVPLKVGLVAAAPIFTLVILGLAFPRRRSESTA